MWTELEDRMLLDEMWSQWIKRHKEGEKQKCLLWEGSHSVTFFSSFSSFLPFFFSVSCSYSHSTKVIKSTQIFFQVVKEQTKTFVSGIDGGWGNRGLVLGCGTPAQEGEILQRVIRKRRTMSDHPTVGVGSSEWDILARKESVKKNFLLQSNGGDTHPKVNPLEMFSLFSFQFGIFYSSNVFAKTQKPLFISLVPS